MDVLSIDQANHTEKSSQVGLMGTIFKAATCVFASAGADEDDSKFVVQEILAHAEYIEHRRIIHGQKEDPPLDSGYCKDCGQSLQPMKDTCAHCPGRSSYNKCSMCRRNLTTQWYIVYKSSQLLCRICKSLHHNEIDNRYESWLFDAWGIVDTYMPNHSWDTYARFLEMPQESQQWVASALSVFSLRPYFTRLWVCASPTAT